MAEGDRPVRREAALDVEVDEQGSFVGSKAKPRWLWSAVDQATNTVLASVFGRRQDVVFKERPSLLRPFNMARY